MAMQALTVNRSVSHLALIRDIFKEESEEEDAFMRTFDQAVTVGEGEEWLDWAARNMVDERLVRDHEMMLLSFLRLSPFLMNPYNRVERMDAQEEVRNFLVGEDSEYTDFLFFLLR